MRGSDWQANWEVPGFEQVERRPDRLGARSLTGLLIMPTPP
jgi:hypothetical protein